MEAVSPPVYSHKSVVLPAAGLAMLASAWLATQGSIAPQNPGKLAATVLIVLQSLPSVGMIWLAAAGFGWPIRKLLLPGSASPVVMQVGTGLAALLLLNWCLATLGLLSRPGAFGLGGAGLVLLLGQAFTHRAQLAAFDLSQWKLPWTLVLLAPAIALLLVAATIPPGRVWPTEAYGYDVLTYHLQLPREWLAAGHMRPLEHNVYSFLPSLQEAAYLLLGTMHGDVHSAMYPAQLFHASLTIFSSLALAALIAQATDLRAGFSAAACFLGLPWVLICGSMAYNEMLMIAMGILALIAAIQPGSERLRGAAVVGVLLGCATLAKLTGGPLLALPVLLLMAVRLNHTIRWRKRPSFAVGLRAAAIATLALLLTLSPWLARNTLASGNPVFPMLAQHLGSGHWSPELVARWDAAHQTPFEPAAWPADLGREWLLNVGYGAVGGYITHRTAGNVAQFDTEWGLPLFGIAVALGAMLAIERKETRRLGSAMLLILLVQIAVWLLFTHHQSRFMLPSVIPMTVLLGVGFGRLSNWKGLQLRWAVPLAYAMLPLAIATSAISTLSSATPRIMPDGAEEPEPAPVWAVIDAAPPNHPINELPPRSVVYLVADNTMLFYLNREAVYHTPFDPSPLGNALRASNGDPAAATQRLIDAGITHVWVGRSELARLHSSYGYDPAITAQSLKQIIREWSKIGDLGPNSALYRLPSRSKPPSP